ncbi:MAG: hypothetical protein ACI3XM_03825 [Eubacteriales bacterium]
MGFGILFIGYMFLLSVPLRAMGISAELLGYIFMLRAFSQLRQYQREFAQAYQACFVLLPFGIFSFALQLIKWFGAETLYETVYSATDFLYSILLSAALLLFHYYLLNGIEKQARDVELSDIVIETKRNRIMTVVYFVLLIAINFLNIPALTEIIPYAAIVGFVSLFGIAWILLNAKMIFHCYMWICLPGDEEMLPGGSRILPNLFNIQKKKGEDTGSADAEAEKRKQKELYNEEMRRRQLARTKKNKRGKK